MQSRLASPITSIGLDEKNIVKLQFNPLMPGQSNFDGYSSMALKRRCGIILAQIFKGKVPMERSFPHLNGDTSFVRIRRELELWRSFEVHQLKEKRWL